MLRRLISLPPFEMDRYVFILDIFKDSEIWNNFFSCLQEHSFLRCRRRELAFTCSTPLDIRIVPLLQQTNFYRLSRVGFISLDWHLIIAFVERWHPKTHTFHLPSGECTITLEDVNIQLGLSIDGLLVIGSTHQDWHQVWFDLLGIVPPADQLKGCRLNLA